MHLGLGSAPVRDGSGLFRTLVFHFRIGCLARIGFIQNVCLPYPSWLLSVGRRPIGFLVRTNRSCPCARPIVLEGCVDNAFLEAPCCLLNFVDNLCLGFPFWFLSVGWRWNWRLGPLLVSEELVIVPSSVSSTSWLVKSFRRDSDWPRSLLISASPRCAGRLQNLTLEAPRP